MLIIIISINTFYGRFWKLVTALLTRLVIRYKQNYNLGTDQLIGVSSLYYNTLCGCPLLSWTYGTDSRHTNSWPLFCSSY